MQFSPSALALIGLLLAAWVAGAAWLMIAASAKAKAAEGARRASRRMARMIDEAPAIPLLVRADGRIEGSERLAGWFGLPKLPQYLSDLGGGEAQPGEAQVVVGEVAVGVAVGGPVALVEAGAEQDVDA